MFHRFIRRKFKKSLRRRFTFRTRRNFRFSSRIRRFSYRRAMVRRARPEMKWSDAALNLTSSTSNGQIYTLITPQSIPSGTSRNMAVGSRVKFLKIHYDFWITLPPNSDADRPPFIIMKVLFLVSRQEVADMASYVTSVFVNPYNFVDPTVATVYKELSFRLDNVRDEGPAEENRNYASVQGLSTKHLKGTILFPRNVGLALAGNTIETPHDQMYVFCISNTPAYAYTFQGRSRTWFVDI